MKKNKTNTQTVFMIIDSNQWMHIHLNRPKKRNALNKTLIKELSKIFSKTKILRQKKEPLRGIILKGEGCNFSSGADLQWIYNTKEEWILFNLLKQIQEHPLPVIAQVHGMVFGGAIGLMSVCDFVSAQTNSQFCFSEVKWGLVPSMIAPFVLQKIPFDFAKKSMLSAQPFHCQTALKNHLIDFTGSLKECNQWRNHLIKNLNETHPQAFHQTKDLLYQLSSPLITPKIKKLTLSILRNRKEDPSVQKRIQQFLDKKSK